MCGCGGGFGGGGESAAMEVFTFTHDQFQDASMQFSINAFTLGAKQGIRGMILRPTIQWAGTGITLYQLMVGIADDLERWVLRTDVSSAGPSGTNKRNAGPFWDFPDYAAPVTVRITALTEGANTDQSTSGEVKLTVLRSVEP